jgi:hypothetical protein
MTWNLPQHSYEEIRDVIVDILLERETVNYEPSQWVNLCSGVAEVFARRSATPTQPFNRHDQARLHPSDAELSRDVFWDLFRQGFITLGMNDSNPNWPFFRLSHFGQTTLQTQSPYRFHDTASFIAMVRKEIPDVSPEAVVYLEEAVSAFYAGCLLAACVMIGAAAEAEFLRLVDIAANSAKHGTTFAPVTKLSFIRQKITKFHVLLKPLLPSLSHNSVEDLDTNLAMIQSVLRIARNEAGHPTASTPEREQVYVFLQLFVPFARQLMRLRKALT